MINFLLLTYIHGTGDRPRFIVLSQGLPVSGHKNQELALKDEKNTSLAHLFCFSHWPQMSQLSEVQMLDMFTYATFNLTPFVTRCDNSLRDIDTYPVFKTEAGTRTHSDMP